MINALGVELVHYVQRTEKKTGTWYDAALLALNSALAFIDRPVHFLQAKIRPPAH